MEKTVIAKAREEISSHIETKLNRNLPYHTSKEVYQYSVLPPGKLIRPLFVKALMTDLMDLPLDTKSELNSKETLLSCAIEVHHAYSLIHDDMPCMDNDDYRRGKLTTHKAFGEWQALLAGDGLLNLSYRFLSLIPDNSKIFSFFSWAMGPKGLILGQWLDLQNKDENFNINTQLEIMKLKTARLMQCAFVCSFLLLKKDEIKKNIKNPFFTFFKLGHKIGIMFQLLDDLVDLAEQKENPHELEINPFIHLPSESANILISSLNFIQTIIHENGLNNIKIVLTDLFQKNSVYLDKNEEFFKELNIPRFEELTNLLKILVEKEN